MSLSPSVDRPRLVRLHATDNVGVVVNDRGVAAGTALGDGLVALEAVPPSHKIALEPITEGAAVRRYGEVIGWARRDLPAGSWVKEADLDLPTPPTLDSLPKSTAVPAPGEPLERVHQRHPRRHD